MLNKSKIALALMLVLGTASAATAATKHPVRHRTTVEHRTTIAHQSIGRGAYGYADRPMSYDRQGSSDIITHGGANGGAYNQPPDE
jgi:hypothetical protein